MELEFFGAAGEVTGSCHILRVNDQQVLLDCGMIQGGRKNEARNADPFPFDARKIDAVVLSHAHIDHSGRLPLLVQRGFRGSIHTHNASKELTSILLRDSAGLQEMEAKRRSRKRIRSGKKPLEPLYDSGDAERAVARLKGHRYRKSFEPVPGIRVQFFDAGHILGSAVVQVDVTEGEISKRIIFSGDLGQYDAPILRDPVSPEQADLVLMESTYGGRTHRDRIHTITEIGEIVSEAEHRHGNILIPAFAVGRSQEVMYQFGKHFEQWNMERWQIYLDSPLGIEASEIYWDYPHLYDEEASGLRAKVKTMPPLPNLRLSRTADESRAINRLESGAIVIAGSGMCTGGRILHHLKHNAWRPETQIIIVGYQAMGSTGRKLVEGDKYVRIHGEQIRVKAKVHTVGGLSAHGDQADLLDWFGKIGGPSGNPETRPQLYLVHGEVEAGQTFKNKLKADLGVDARLTQPGLKVDLATLPG